jgi:hypothetical protein
MKVILLLLSVVLVALDATAQRGHIVNDSITGFYGPPLLVTGRNLHDVKDYRYEEIGGQFRDRSYFSITPPMTLERFEEERKNKDHYVKAEPNSKLEVILHRSYDTVISGYKAHVYEYATDKYDEQILHYDVFLINDSSVLLFSGFDRDKGIHIEKFKATVQSIRFE